MLKSIPLKANKYTDTGYRLRKNIVETYDSWITAAQTNKVFFDLRNYNYDQFDVDSRYFPYIAQMYFRLETSQIHHQREEYSFSDLLGDMGGICDILLSSFIFFIGGFISFNSSVEIMKVLYSNDQAL